MKQYGFIKARRYVVLGLCLSLPIVTAQALSPTKLKPLIPLNFSNVVKHTDLQGCRVGGETQVDCMDAYKSAGADQNR